MTSVYSNNISYANIPVKKYQSKPFSYPPDTDLPHEPSCTIYRSFPFHPCYYGKIWAHILYGADSGQNIFTGQALRSPSTLAVCAKFPSE